jgi:hypothetical protein
VLVHDREASGDDHALNLAAKIPFGIVYEDDATRRAARRVTGGVPVVGRGRDLEAAAGSLPLDLRVFLLLDHRPGDAERVPASARAARRDGQRPSNARSRSSIASLTLRIGWRSPDERFAMVPASQLMRTRWPVWKIDGASTSNGGTPAARQCSSKPSAKLAATVATKPAAAATARRAPPAPCPSPWPA